MHTITILTSLKHAITNVSTFGGENTVNLPDCWGQYIWIA